MLLRALPLGSDGRLPAPTGSRWPWGQGRLVSGVLVTPVISTYLDTGFVPRLPTLFVASFLTVIGCLSLTIGLVLYYYQQYKLGQEKMKYDVQLAQMETRQQMELNEKKLSFFTNVSHEFRTPLTLIINPIREMMQGANETLAASAISSGPSCTFPRCASM